MFIAKRARTSRLLLRLRVELGRTLSWATACGPSDTVTLNGTKAGRELNSQRLCGW